MSRRFRLFADVINLRVLGKGKYPELYSMGPIWNECILGKGRQGRFTTHIHRNQCEAGTECSEDVCKENF